MKQVPPHFAAPIDRLRWVLKALRAPDGCPWDRAQTLKTIEPCLQEECYELLDAMAGDDLPHHREELGDVLLQVLFQCDIREEQGAFGFDDVANALADKLIRRHPHVFGDVSAADSEQALKNWERIKQTERKGAEASALDGVPAALPALLRAQRTQHKAAKVGFDWKGAEGPDAKLDEEIAELRAAMRTGQTAHMAEELGDALFTLVNLARHLDIDAESALRAATDKFARRFKAVERRVRASGRDMAKLSLTELDAEWDAVKRDAGH